MQHTLLEFPYEFQSKFVRRVQKLRQEGNVTSPMCFLKFMNLKLPELWFLFFMGRHISVLGNTGDLQ